MSSRGTAAVSLSLCVGQKMFDVVKRSSSSERELTGGCMATTSLVAEMYNRNRKKKKNVNTHARAQNNVTVSMEKDDVCHQTEK